jgi:triosephosphate isomerase
MLQFMRGKLVVGNWKMNLTRPEASSCVETLVRQVNAGEDVEIAICPAYLSIPVVAQLLEDTFVMVGAQDVFWAEQGAFTGKVSAGMLKEAGVQVCIVGHSEPRGRFGVLEVPESTLPYFSETDETVNLKIKSLLFHGIVPILCVGETLTEREAGATDSVIQGQLDRALDGVDASEFADGIVAYEPVWAIGTGRTCITDEASRVCGMIRAHLAKILDAEAADTIRVLYGGSVKAANARELFRAQDIDGGLVGGASLKPEEFVQVIRAARS